jgi:hypothetical protein
MKNFDLEAAKRGAAVCTRGGCKARIVCFNVNNPLFSIVAMVQDPLSGKETPQSYRDDGGWLPANTKCSQDLMMREDDDENQELGKYWNRIVDVNEMAKSATVQDFITVREYWRRVYAGQAMQGIVSALDMNAPIAEDGVASMACAFADALIEELDRRNTK